jgi:hypothetical protein
LVVFFEQQSFWVELVNSRERWQDEQVLEDYVPARFRDFSDPPGWPARKAYNYLVNNVDVIRSNHRALEAGDRLDYDMLNNVLSDGVLRLVDWGSLEAIQGQQTARRRVGGRIETLVAVSRKDGLNPGTAFVRSSVERALFFFAQYIDYRFSDPAYPDASPGKFQVKECLRPGCGSLFIRTPRTLLYCSDDCARKDR